MATTTSWRINACCRRDRQMGAEPTILLAEFDDPALAHYTDRVAFDNSASGDGRVEISEIVRPDSNAATGTDDRQR